MKTDTVALMVVKDVWKTLCKVGMAGKYIPPANGPKKPVAVASPRMKRRRPGLKAEYGGFDVGWGAPE